ncbi:LOW QUALITY PROTEIN: hypothetical protein PHMEG_00019146 [Phytophthora megakarya]|uniref:Uncharacterized protein n=1 Tax=Phytophthora megakarya TaxID=4795 RepID=A0A225VUV3_9STRA|nr:LOW QUALITY PROTEIN: hypothetical protein PHMEG_00019146 [Phytophthora megakarya]
MIRTISTSWYLLKRLYCCILIHWTHHDPTSPDLGDLGSEEVSGNDPDDNRARTWITKVKSAFMRDQASDEKKC